MKSTIEKIIYFLQNIFKRILFYSRSFEVSSGKVVFCPFVSGIDQVDFEGNNAIGCFSEFRGKIKIGYATTIGIHNLIAGEVEIGRYCQFAPHVSINTYNHPQTHLTTYINRRLLDGAMARYKTSRKTTVGNDVWIGKGAILLDGVTIGDGAVIAAGAVVTKDVPPYHIAAGVPAKTIRQRFPDRIIQELLELRWWDKSEEEIEKIADLFHKDLSGKESIYE